METQADGQVALLIDFENLVRGIEKNDTIDCELLLRLAEEYGRVLVANAYADWRMTDVNQYQTELYRLGVELVHVFGKRAGVGYKNAVDVKMAVDAIAAISSLPHIDVFVIVSGDRDFIHVLKALRRHGKMVIGVSPSSSASHDFAALCDRFVRYDALATAYDPPAAVDAPPGEGAGSEDLAPVRQALQSIVGTRPEGIKGAMIKPLLRRELSPSFDESAYGFSRLTDLLRHLSDVVQVVAPRGGGDVLVHPASADISDHESAAAAEPNAERVIRQANLRFYRYQRNPGIRRGVLTRLFDAMTQRQPFSWDDVQQHILADGADGDTSLSVTILSRYRAIIFQARGFIFEPDQDDRSQRERLMRLQSGIDSPQALIRLYEGNVAYKLAAAAGDDGPVSPADLAEVLGLPADDKNELRYCRELLDGVNKDGGHSAETAA